MFVGKTESGSFQVSGLKETGVSENVAKLSDKAQEAFSRLTVEKKSTPLNPRSDA